MKNLTDFQVPNDGELTLCAIDSRIHSMNYEYANVSTFTTAVDSHPKIHITRDLLHPSSSGIEARTLFLPVEEPLFKHLIQIYYQQGFVEVLYTASEHGSFLLRKSALFALNILQGINALKQKFSPYSNENSVSLIASTSQTRGWLHSPIRCLAWHSFSTKIAVAAQDDSIRIYSTDTNLIPILKCKQQKNIACLAWRPLSNSEIAVGCESGIFVWSIDPGSLVTRPSINNAIILYRVDHVPVLSLAWSLQGDTLASVAAYDSTILIWNVELDETSSLKRPGGCGNVLLKWSPVGNKLFSATTGLVFRVWECQRWQAERWNLLSGRIQTACWSPCGTTLLFTTTDEPLVYALSFIQSELVFAGGSKDSPNKAIPIYDLTKVDVEGLIVGGIAQSMDWDPSGQFLAILFVDTDYIAIFHVSTHGIIQLNPSCLVTGMPEEKPSTIAFQKNFEYGACLSIGWSTGRLQHFPIINTEICSPTGIGRGSYNGSIQYNSFNMLNSHGTSFL